MLDKELNKDELAMMRKVFIEVFPILVSKYEPNQIEEATDKTIASLKKVFICLKTENIQ